MLRDALALKSALVGPWAHRHIGGLGATFRLLSDRKRTSSGHVGIVTFLDGTYFQSSAWYPSPPALGFYR